MWGFTTGRANQVRTAATLSKRILAKFKIRPLNIVAVLIEQTCPLVRWARWAIPSTLRLTLRRSGMAQRSSFAEIRAEQARMTASWKAEGHTSEAWAVADPEIVEIFTAGVVFGVNAGRSNRRDPAYTPDEWRRALREAMEKAADLEVKLERATGADGTKVEGL
jgi:hypothetical protein